MQQRWGKGIHFKFTLSLQQIQIHKADISQVFERKTDPLMKEKFPTDVADIRLGF